MGNTAIEPKKTVGIVLPIRLVVRFDTEARMEGLDRSSYIRRLLTRHYYELLANDEGSADV